MIHSQRFTRDERVKRATEIKNLFRNGKKVSTSGAKLFYLPNQLQFNRIGFPLPRGFGNAVERNRSKRYSREAYRINKTYLNTGYDMLFLVYSGSENDSFHSRCVQFRTLCQKAGLLSDFPESVDCGNSL